MRGLPNPDRRNRRRRHRRGRSRTSNRTSSRRHRSRCRRNRRCHRSRRSRSRTTRTRRHRTTLRQPRIRVHTPRQREHSLRGVRTVRPPIRQRHIAVDTRVRWGWEGDRRAARRVRGQEGNLACGDAGYARWRERAVLLGDTGSKGSCACAARSRCRVCPVELGTDDAELGAHACSLTRVRGDEAVRESKLV